MTENTGGQQSRDDAQALLPARSAAEMHLFLDLHPCDCGAARQRGVQELREGGNGGLMSVYAGTCTGCGRQWSVAFSLPESPPPADRIGGSEPSAIIDPGEWLWLSDQDASIPAGGPARPGDRARLGRAAAEHDEAAKFIPPGLDRVPSSAFTTSLGRAMLDAFPHRFLREDLEGRAQLYRAGARRARDCRRLETAS